MLLVGAVVFLFVLNDSLKFEGRVQVFEEAILSMGMWGVMGSIGLMILHSFIPFPAEFLAIANGMVYGPVMGVVITWIGAMLGAYLAFALARFFGRPFVEKLVARKNLHVIDDWTTEKGGRLIFLCRFIPIIAFNLVNYAAGLMRLSWWTFTWATGIGILPMTILMVVMGNSMDTFTWEVWTAIAVGWIVFGLLVIRYETLLLPNNQRKSRLSDTS
jgi:uncharacterized membrane protein YdjX (TVP38/TMEM64 family)